MLIRSPTLFRGNSFRIFVYDACISFEEPLLNFAPTTSIRNVYIMRKDIDGIHVLINAKIHILYPLWIPTTAWKHNTAFHYTLTGWVATERDRLSRQDQHSNLLA